MSTVEKALRGTVVGVFVAVSWALMDFVLLSLFGSPMPTHYTTVMCAAAAGAWVVLPNVTHGGN